MSQALYDAVKSGRVKLDSLNSDGVDALRNYMDDKVTPGGSIDSIQSDQRKTEQTAAFTPQPFNNDPVETQPAEQNKSNFLDKIFKDNPVARVLNYPFAKAAQDSVPDANYLGTDVNARQDFAQRNPIPSTGSPTLDKVGDFAGGIGSFFTPIGGFGTGAQNVASDIVGRLGATKLGMQAESALGNLGAAAANKINPSLLGQGIQISPKFASETAQLAGKGALDFGIANPLNTAATEEPTPQNMVNSAMQGALMGGAMGGGFGILGAGGKLLLDKFKPDAPLPDYSNVSLSQGKGMDNPVKSANAGINSNLINPLINDAIPQSDHNIADIIPSSEPRIREKASGNLEEASQLVKERLKNNPKADTTDTRVIIGASHIADGATTFSDFSKKMIGDFGEFDNPTKPDLKELFVQSKAMYKDAEHQASGVAHLPGVNSGIDPLNGDKVDIMSLEKAIENSDNWKDKNRLLLNRETATRNNEDVMGKDAAIMNKTYIEPVQKSAADRQRFITQERSDIKDLGIKYKSPEDALVQKYGEGKMSEADLKLASPQNWQKIKTAAETMRSKYDKYLGMANEVLTRNGYPEIPKRKDYFPHYEEIDGLMSKLGFGFEDNTLPSDLNGLTANLKPGKNFFTHMLQRKGTDTTLGAMAGHDRYIEGISKIIHQTDNIKRLRGLDTTLRNTHEGTTHLSDFLANLTDYTNILAGKKTEMDRSLEAAVGRNLYSAADWLKKRVGANMIGGSVSSALTNSIPVTQLLAETSKSSVLKGLASALKNIKGNDAIGQDSNFLARRFTSHKLAMGPIDKAQNTVGLLFKGIDHFTSNLVMRAKYYENLDKKGMPQAEALKEADKYATKMMADRSEGSMPTLFHSRTFGLVTQFQLEVNNQLSHLFKDMPKSMSKAKYASAITQVFIYDYLYNQLYEKITGNRPAFDPMGVASQALQDFANPRLSKGKAAGNLVGNIANNLPFASVATGGRIPLGAAMPNVFGANGLIKGNAKVGDELLKPAKYLALPFGGSQINKTITGLNAVNQGGVKGKDANGNEIIKYPIEKSPANIIRGSLFGKSALPETNSFYNNNTPSLTANETKILENSSDPKAEYTKILQRKEIDGLKTQLTKVKNEKIPLDEKKKQIDIIMNRLQKVSR